MAYTIWQSPNDENLVLKFFQDNGTVHIVIFSHKSICICQELCQECILGFITPKWHCRKSKDMHTKTAFQDSYAIQFIYTFGPHT